MDENFSIKLVESRDNQEVIDFLSEEIPFEYNRNVFSWEYNHPESVFMVLRNIENKVVGSQGMIPIELSFLNTKFLSMKSETSYLSDKAQGKGLFKELYKEVLKVIDMSPCDFVWGFTKLGDIWQKLDFRIQNNCLFTATLLLNDGEKLIGNSKVNGIRDYLRILKYKYESIKTKQFIKNKRKHLNCSKINIQIGAVDSEKIQQFNENEKCGNSELKLTMNASFIQNRIIENPFVEYTSYYAYENNHLVGYCILTKDTKKSGEVYLSDINCFNKEIQEALIIEICQELIKGDSICRLKYFGNKLNHRSLDVFNFFDSLGGKMIDSEMYIVYYPSSKIIKSEWNEKLESFQNWNINGLWTEGINQ